MRGVVVFMTALFLLGLWYLLGTMMIEPLMDIALSVDLGVIGGSNRVDTLRRVYFLYAPAVYIVGWFAWAVRYYASKERFRSRVGPR